MLKTTALGSPVVPEVYMSARIDSIVMCSWRESGIGVEFDSDAKKDGS